MYLWRNIVMALVALILAQPALAAANSPGSLISATSVTAPSGMQAWRIAYWTSDARNAPLSVTGMVVALLTLVAGLLLLPETFRRRLTD